MRYNEVDKVFTVTEYDKKRLMDFIIEKKPNTISNLIHLLYKHGLIDSKKMFIAIVREFYFEAIKKGKEKNKSFQILDAKTITAEKFCIAEETVEKYVYQLKDINLKLN